MRTVSKAAVLSLALGLLLPLSAAQAAGWRHRRMDPAQRLERMTKRYDLTADQQAQVKKILDEERQKMKEQMQAMRDLHKGYRDQIRGVLTADQQKKFDEDTAKMEKRMEKWKKRHEKMMEDGK